MVASLDQSVGRILGALEEQGLTDNTLVVFTSDNGGLTQRFGKHDGFTENLPLRRGKGSAYEGGVRVPAIIRWPGVTVVGKACDEPIMTTDYFPTLLDVAGVKSNGEQNVDGRSIVSLLRDTEASIDRNLYWHYPHYHAGGDGPYSAVRSGRFRLIEFHEDRSVRLYDLKNDIGEQQDLSNEIPEKTEALRDDLHRWRESVQAQMPTPNPNYHAQREQQVSREKRSKK